MLQVSDRLLATGDEEGAVKVWRTGAGGSHDHELCVPLCVVVGLEELEASATYKGEQGLHI